MESTFRHAKPDIDDEKPAKRVARPPTPLFELEHASMKLKNPHLDGKQDPDYLYHFGMY